MPMVVRKIISGGQTGADRAALDFALSHGFEIGGYIPKGRIAEDGKISARYEGLMETESVDPAERTELNVVRSDGTLIISHGPLTGGSKLTAEAATRAQKPVLHIDQNRLPFAREEIRNWISKNGIAELNIAGPRASEDPAIYDSVKKLLESIFPK